MGAKEDNQNRRKWSHDTVGAIEQQEYRQLFQAVGVRYLCWLYEKRPAKYSLGLKSRQLSTAFGSATCTDKIRGENGPIYGVQNQL